MKKFLIISLSLLTISTYATENPDLSRYEKVTKIEVSGIVTPKVVKYQTTDYLGSNTLLLNDKQEVISHKWITQYEKTKKQNITVSNTSSEFEGTKKNLVDNNSKTHFSFHPTQNGPKTVTIRFPEKTEVSSIYVSFDSGIISPKTVSVRADFGDGKLLSILDQVKFSRRIKFPKVMVMRLEIAFETAHFLRISDIMILGQDESQKKDELIFFAEDGKTYQLYSNASFGQKRYKAKEVQPLKFDLKTPVFTLVQPSYNSLFNPDFDKDGINDDIDLCPMVADPVNTDSDRNGRGDVCEDPDLDKIYSNKDNCPFAYNPDQKDSDQDGQGDKCDEEEGRITENTDFLLWIVFGVGALVLGGVVMRNYNPA